MTINKLRGEDETELVDEDGYTKSVPPDPIEYHYLLRVYSYRNGVVSK